MSHPLACLKQATHFCCSQSVKRNTSYCQTNAAKYVRLGSRETLKVRAVVTLMNKKSFNQNLLTQTQKGKNRCQSGAEMLKRAQRSCGNRF